MCGRKGEQADVVKARKTGRLPRRVLRVCARLCPRTMAAAQVQKGGAKRPKWHSRRSLLRRYDITSDPWRNCNSTGRLGSDSVCYDGYDPVLIDDLYCARSVADYKELRAVIQAQGWVSRWSELKAQSPHGQGCGAIRKPGPRTHWNPWGPMRNLSPIRNPSPI